jgi:hypothetical protein
MVEYLIFNKQTVPVFVFSTSLKVNYCKIRSDGKMGKER